MRGHLGPYEILAPLGSGGMGEVYKARDRRLDRVVAIKVLTASSLQRADARSRFEREARAVAALDHPHICKLYDIGHDEGVDYLVMQYLEGQTLASRLVWGPLPLPQAAEYAKQIADAIDAAHRQGVTHRDLKPSNIMLTRRAGAVLLDFGLARLAATDRALQEMAGSTTMDLTREGAIVGTVRYMAPEVLDGKRADARSDLFSFGAVVYEMVTGRRAFDGDSEARVIAAIMAEDPPPLAVVRPEAPPELDSVVRRCLKKDPDERWQNAGDLASQLDWVAEALRTPTPRSPATPEAPARPKRRALPVSTRWMAATLVLAGLAGAGWWALNRRTTAPVVAPLHLVALPCRGNDATARALCDGVTEAALARLMPLTLSHPVQVTPQLGGLSGSVTTDVDARRLLGASRVLQGEAAALPDGFRLSYRVAGDRTEAAFESQTLSIASASVFEGQDRFMGWLVRVAGLDLTHPERESLVARPTADAGGNISYLIGLGYLMKARDPAAADEAIHALTTAIASDAQFAAAHAALGMAWRAKHLGTRDADAGERARDACAEGARLQPNLADAHVCLGMLHYASRELEPAAAAFARAIAADPSNDDAIVWLGRTQEDLHLSSEAERTYRRAVEQRANYATAYLWLANFYRRQARYEDAAGALERAAALIPNSVRIRAAVATPLIYLGRYEEAIAALKEAVSVEPTREALVAWGMTLFRMRRFEEAASVIERARALGAPDWTLVGSLARNYYWWGTPDSRAEATALYHEALQLVERDLSRPAGTLPKADLHIAAADYLAKLGRPDEARAHLQQVGLNVDDPERPTDPHQLFFAALVYAQLGERETTLKWLERAVYWGVPAAELRAWAELDTLRSDRAFQSLVGTAPVPR
jgi:serine/threonine-protein kinase